MLLLVVLRLVLLLSGVAAVAGNRQDPSANCRSVMSSGRYQRVGLNLCGDTGKNGSCIPQILVDNLSDETSLITDSPRRIYDGEAISRPYVPEDNHRNCTPVLTLHGELLAILGNCSSLDDLPYGIYYPLRCNGVVRAAEANDAAAPDFYRYTTSRQPGFYELNCSMLSYGEAPAEREGNMWEVHVYASWDEIGEVQYDVCVKSGGSTCTNQTVGTRTCPYLHDFSHHQNGGQHKDMLRNKIMLGVFPSFVLLLSLCLCFHKKCCNTAIFHWKKRSTEDKYFESCLRSCENFVPPRYTYSDVEKMTSAFSDKLGEGGFASVYRGLLDDGRPVAVKVLKDSRGSVKDFFSEVITIGCTYHVNIVTLLGFCSEGSKRVLIYEFMPNGSLDKFIFDRKRTPSVLDAAKLLKIAIGVARGLEYLHHGCNVGILHFDIKPHNILLDHGFCPKIADFGLAKLCRSGDSRIRMPDARGTVGYIAPEVCSGSSNGRASSKSDVYSYGMMLLEMVGGRKNFTTRVDRTSEVYFPDWVRKHVDLDGRSLTSSLGLKTDDDEEETARRMVAVGLWCIQTEPADRPLMTMVLDMLEGRIQELQMPPLPAVISSPSRSVFQSLTISESQETLIPRTTEHEHITFSK